MKISIFGLGYVGCVSMGCLAECGHQIIGVDVSQTKIDLINNGKATITEKDIDTIIARQHKLGSIVATNDYKKAVLESEISIVTVGTPISENGHLNLDFIFKVTQDIAEILKHKNNFHIIAIRSTVVPGTISKVVNIIEEISGKKNNNDFAVVLNPEFLREGTSVNDFYNPPYILVGTDNEKALNSIKQLYAKINAPVILCTINEAEIIKSINNSFHALKVSFANEVGNVCKALNINARKVMDIFVMDTQLNISPYYLKPGFAYGGSCLPKDLQAFQTLAHDHYLELPVIQSINKSNELQIKRCIQIVSKYELKKIGFLGLTFKEGTDDLRNSPVVSVIEALLGKGFDIKIYDENVRYSQLTGKNKEFIDLHIPHLSKLMVDKIDEIEKHSELIIIATREEKFEKFLLNSKKSILDFVGIDRNLEGLENYNTLNW